MNPILALDLGRARIGVAISDELQLFGASAGNNPSR